MLFNGIHTLVALCSAMLILGAMFGDRNAFNAVLGHPILVYIGQRSYALYLWHAAINVWLRSFDPLPHFWLTIVLSFAAAELSYRLIEAPALRLKSRRGKQQAAGSTATQPESRRNSAA